MFSAALLDVTRLPDRWAVAAAFGGEACGGTGVTIGPDLSVAGALCLGDGPAGVSGRLSPSGPGRFALPQTGEWWVIWVDSGYRTLAVGTPGGEWGFVLNRGGPLPDDRLAAAAEIFDFNGYDARSLVRVP
jgi:apolipoprotein D and lipocalin family protein